MDKTGRNGLRVGDINSSEFKNRYSKLALKHAKMLGNNYLDYDLDLLEKEMV